MADEDKDKGLKPWRDQAIAEGYAFMPKADLEALKTDSNTLKDIRSAIPSEGRDNIIGFIEAGVEARNDLESVRSNSQEVSQQLKDELKTIKSNLTKAQNENEDLRNANSSLEVGNKRLTMIGHVKAIQQQRNAYVDDSFIPDADIDNFDLGRFDLSNEDGLKSMAEAVWKEILEPAGNRQQQTLERVAGRSGTPDQGGFSVQTDQSGNAGRTSIPGWGSNV
jgi:hypothetical protein